MSAIYTLISLLALCSLAIAQQPKLDTNPPKFYNLDPSRPTISCSLTGTEEIQNYKLTWVGPNNLTDPAEIERKHHVNYEQPGSVDLEFAKFGDEELGTYYCLAVSNSSQLPSYNISLEVYRDTTPSFTDCPSMQTYVVGGFGKIVCRFNLKHKLFDVVLSKENRRAGNRYKHDEASGSFFIDGNIDMSDAGNYILTARYKPNPSKKLFQNISVIVVPPAPTPNPISASSGTGASGQDLNSNNSDYTLWIVGAVTFIAVLVLLDLMCCVCFNIGMAYFIRSKCCPSKTTSVINDKITSDTT